MSQICRISLPIQGNTLGHFLSCLPELCRSVGRLLFKLQQRRRAAVFENHLKCELLRLGLQVLPKTKRFLVLSSHGMSLCFFFSSSPAHPAGREGFHGHRRQPVHLSRLAERQPAGLLLLRLLHHYTHHRPQACHGRAGGSP